MEKTPNAKMRLEPGIDQRSDGIAEEAIEQGQDRQALISMLVKELWNPSTRKELPVFPKGGATCTPMSERSKQIILEHGNVEMFEICELSSKAQCVHRIHLPQHTFSREHCALRGSR